MSSLSAAATTASESIASSSSSASTRNLNPPLATPLWTTGNTHQGLVEGRCFLITGGTQGLGLAVARQLLQAGAAGLVLVARSSAQGALAVQELRALAATRLDDSTTLGSTSTTTTTACCRVEFLQADLADAAQASSVVSRAVQLLHPPQILSGIVNCAATTARGNLFTETADGFDQHMAINVRAPFLIAQAAAQHMIQHKHYSGSIVNVISCAAYGGAPFVMAYSASKAALVALTKCHAAELAPHGIRVNGINLGWCYTTNEDRIQSQLKGSSEWIAPADASVPLGRILRPEDAAVTIVFLLSSASSMTTGTVMELHPEYAHGMLSLASKEEDAGR